LLSLTTIALGRTLNASIALVGVSPVVKGHCSTSVHATGRKKTNFE
jgi:hypothetical protein